MKIFDFGTTAYLAGSGSVVTMGNTKGLVGDSTTPVEDVTIKGKKGTMKFIKRGTSNKQPVEIIEKINELSTLGANVAFNAKMAYGDGIMVAKKVRDKVTGKITIEEQLESEQPEIFKFLTDNNYVNSTQEWSMDIVVYYEGYAEFIFGRGVNKIVQINPVESINSRLTEANEETGEIEYHGYSVKWHEGNPEDVKVTRLLDRRAPIRDLRIKRGMDMNLQGKKEKVADEKYILQLMQPTPGRYYNGKPYWWAIFESGWYDIAVAIPKFKKALLKNQMTLKYHVEINEGFWPKYFQSKGITKDDPKAVKACRTEFLTNMDKFLSSEENAGKSFVSEFKYDQLKGYEVHDIIIKAVESFIKGGEYLEDSQEVTNVICYAMEIHPSIIGASGKNGSINGTEARELFIIKQAMMKPIRDLLVLPLYIAKDINGWDKDIHFVIPNIMLTTLDKNTGAEKSIGNQKI